MYQDERAYDRLIAKDEIARSFLRQREYHDQREDKLQVSCLLIDVLLINIVYITV